MRYAIAGLTSILALVILLVFLQACGSGGRSGSWIGSAGEPPARNLEGYWEGILPDGNFDGENDEFPYYYIFIDITSHENGAISGHFHRQVGAVRSDAPLSGTVQNGEFRLSVAMNNETLTFSGSLASVVQDYEGEHLVADWAFPGGHSGVVVLVSVATHIQLPEREASDSELASLTKDGGSGRPLILVHGLDSHPSAWNPIVGRLRDEGYFNHYEVWRFGYDTRQGFETIGPEFYQLATDERLVNSSPVLVAHSMGGIVSRSYIALGGSFTKLVTLGTPHVGTPTGAGGIFTGPGTLEMSPCTPELQGLFAQETTFNNFPDFATVSGKITGEWRWITIHKCWSVCAWGHCWTKCANVPAYLWQFDRDYNTALKAGWTFINAVGYGDNDGAVPTCSANFCVGASDGWPCVICPPINFEHDKHLTNYDHFMLTDPNAAPDVYDFITGHLDLYI